MRKPQHIIDHETAMFTRFGYRPVSPHPCPRVVAGRRCLRHRDALAACLCVEHAGLLDHARLWRDRDGRLVMTAEPYGTADVSGLPAFAAACRALGLRVTLDPDNSPWCPGWTVLVTVRPYNVQQVPA